MSDLIPETESVRNLGPCKCCERTPCIHARRFSDAKTCSVGVSEFEWPGTQFYGDSQMALWQWPLVFDPTITPDGDGGPRLYRIDSADGNEVPVSNYQLANVLLEADMEDLGRAVGVGPFRAARTGGEVVNPYQGHLDQPNTVTLPPSLHEAITCGSAAPNGGMIGSGIVTDYRAASNTGSATVLLGAVGPLQLVLCGQGPLPSEHHVTVTFASGAALHVIERPETSEFLKRREMVLTRPGQPNEYLGSHHHIRFKPQNTNQPNETSWWYIEILIRPIYPYGSFQVVTAEGGLRPNDYSYEKREILEEGAGGVTRVFVYRSSTLQRNGGSVVNRHRLIKEDNLPPARGDLPYNQTIRVPPPDSIADIVVTNQGTGYPPYNRFAGSTLGQPSSWSWSLPGNAGTTRAVMCNANAYVWPTGTPLPVTKPWYPVRSNGQRGTAGSLSLEVQEVGSGSSPSRTTIANVTLTWVNRAEGFLGPNMVGYPALGQKNLSIVDYWTGEIEIYSQTYVLAVVVATKDQLNIFLRRLDNGNPRVQARPLPSPVTQFGSTRINPLTWELSYSDIFQGITRNLIFKLTATDASVDTNLSVLGYGSGGSNAANQVVVVALLLFDVTGPITGTEPPPATWSVVDSPDPNAVIVDIPVGSISATRLPILSAIPSRIEEVSNSGLGMARRDAFDFDSVPRGRTFIAGKGGVYTLQSQQDGSVKTHTIRLPHLPDWRTCGRFEVLSYGLTEVASSGFDGKTYCQSGPLRTYFSPEYEGKTVRIYAEMRLTDATQVGILPYLEFPYLVYEGTVGPRSTDPLASFLVTVNPLSYFPATKSFRDYYGFPVLTAYERIATGSPPLVGWRRIGVVADPPPGDLIRILGETCTPGVEYTLIFLTTSCKSVDVCIAVSGGASDAVHTVTLSVEQDGVPITRELSRTGPGTICVCLPLTFPSLPITQVLEPFELTGIQADIASVLGTTTIDSESFTAIDRTQIPCPPKYDVPGWYCVGLGPDGGFLAVDPAAIGCVYLDLESDPCNEDPVVAAIINGPHNAPINGECYSEFFITDSSGVSEFVQQFCFVPEGY